MGIPHLITALRPYTSSVCWEQTAELGDYPKKVEFLIIDGPSLAYDIYYQCLSFRLDAANALEAIPSYQEVGDFAVRWLENIEQFGLKVKHIYFDGFLPEEKTTIRYQRLEKYAAQCRAFKLAYREHPVSRGYALTKSSLSRLQDENETFQRRSVPGKLRRLPAAPFLVPAVIESLMESRYAQVTKLVPYEADDYCIQACEEVEDIVLTSDSDLLVKQRKSDESEGVKANSVIFFSDLDFTRTLAGRLTLHAVRYQPKVIKQALGFEIREIAYIMMNDPNMPARQCAQRLHSLYSHESLGSNNLFISFMKTYEIQHSPAGSCISKLLGTNHPKESIEFTLQSVLSKLDPRTSEFVLQFVPMLLNPSARATCPKPNIQVTRYIFLPFIMDDSDRSSAWRPSINIRQLAYSIMKTLDEEVDVISEVDRRGTRMVASDVVTIETETLMSQLRDLVDYMTREIALKRDVDADETTTWRYFGLRTTLRALCEDENSFPAETVIQELLQKVPIRLSWAAFHLHGQVQATLYSLRILKQVLSVYMASYEGCSEINPCREVFEGLQKILNEMPKLRVLFGNLCERLVENYDEHIASALYKDMYPSRGKELKGSGGKKKKRKLKAKGKGIERPSDSTRATSNKYGVLGVG